MKKLSLFLILLLLATVICGCMPAPSAQIAATTLPVYEFTSYLCQNTDITVYRLVTENISCLHDYTLQVSQMRAIEGAELIVVSGAGLESFLEDALAEKECIIDASDGIPLICSKHTHNDFEEEHHHENDPHIWLNISHARTMAHNIYDGLVQKYPQYTEIFDHNMASLDQKFNALKEYGQQQLASLGCNQLITFHDGFTYFAEYFNLHILQAVEEESGSEASARELKELIQLVKQYDLPAIFTEINGSTAAADIICNETGTQSFSLDMAMSGESYFDTMYYNIDTIKEALG